MSDLSYFSSIKESFQHNDEAAYRLTMELHQIVKRDRSTHSPTLGQDAKKAAVAELAFADVQADFGNGQDAKAVYFDAINLLKEANKAGLDINSLEKIANQVGRKIH